MEFAELLQDIIKNHEEVTAYSIAKNIKCGRTWIQKVVTGDRSLSYEFIGPLCDYLKNYVGETTIHRLYETFAEEYFGAKQYKLIQYIRKRLERMDRLGEYLEHGSDTGKPSIERFMEISKIQMQEKSVLTAVGQIIEEEILNARQQEREIKIYVHFPSDWEELRDFLLYMLKDLKICHAIDFKGILAVSNETDKDVLQIENFLTSCEYAMYYLNIYNSTNTTNTFESVNMFPYYVITTSQVLLISEDRTSCLKVEEEAQIRNCQKMFDKKLNSCQPFVQELNPYIYTTTILPEIKNMEEVYMISESLCTERYYTKEIIERVVSEEFPDRELAIAAVCSFYETVRGSKTHTLFSLESLMNFVEGEHTKAKKTEYQLNESQMLRLHLLRQTYDEYLTDKEMKIHVLDRSKYKIHKGFHLCLISERMLNFVNYRHKGGTLQNEMGFYVSAPVAKAMRNFYTYLSNSRVCLNREATLDAMRVYLEAVTGEVLPRVEDVPVMVGEDEDVVAVSEEV